MLCFFRENRLFSAPTRAGHVQTRDWIDFRQWFSQIFLLFLSLLCICVIVLLDFFPAMSYSHCSACLLCLLHNEKEQEFWKIIVSVKFTVVMNTNLTFPRICAEMSLRPGKTMPRQLQDPGRQLRDLVPIGICLLIEPASGKRPLSGSLQAHCNPRPAKEYLFLIPSLPSLSASL